MKQEMVDILAGLKTQWGILKDDKKTKKERTVACGKVCKLSEQAKEVDPKWELLDMNNTKYAEFLPTEYVAKSDVIWGEVPIMSTAETESLITLKRLEAIAVVEIQKKLPNERTDSQKFGMIVSAYTEKLINIYIFQNS